MRSVWSSAATRLSCGERWILQGRPEAWRSGLQRRRRRRRPIGGPGQRRSRSGRRSHDARAEVKRLGLKGRFDVTDVEVGGDGRLRCYRLDERVGEEKQSQPRAPPRHLAVPAPQYHEDMDPWESRGGPTATTRRPRMRTTCWIAQSRRLKLSVWPARPRWG